MNEDPVSLPSFIVCYYKTNIIDRNHLSKSSIYPFRDHRVASRQLLSRIVVAVEGADRIKKA